MYKQDAFAGDGDGVSRDKFLGDYRKDISVLRWEFAELRDEGQVKLRQRWPLRRAGDPNLRAAGDRRHESYSILCN